MVIIPAIDLQGGQCVRLRQGRADESTVYSADPVAMARRWQDEGAERLHVVDLDGAFQGRPAHLKVIERIAAALTIPVEVGGGLRTDDDVHAMLETGVACAIIGTRAFADPESLAGSVARFGKKLAVGIDARDGFVQVKGWVETTSMRAVDLARKADALGVSLLIVTDTATDGMMQGTNVAAVAEICRAVRCRVIASGGVTSPEDVRRLNALQCDNLYGAIVGKALYEGTTTLAAMQEK
ncbi:MAG TPA: 1-(5-phosphoribosyl)-5-[(5-phosphoribosylamino)methylideneamino]imidazole-4-carboxamide isomerase [Verrucomicrobia bacterium]|nr:1-(5-phosphoribosyl)-5-[(5-phosphoribosylamino)methylideneamino]imidazole-4-carboxamide isomerase [Verrucomicrobiota bacterium]